MSKVAQLSNNLFHSKPINSYYPLIYLVQEWSNTFYVLNYIFIISVLWPTWYIEWKFANQWHYSLPAGWMAGWYGHLVQTGTVLRRYQFVQTPQNYETIRQIPEGGCWWCLGNWFLSRNVINETIVGTTTYCYYILLILLPATTTVYHSAWWRSCRRALVAFSMTRRRL